MQKESAAEKMANSNSINSFTKPIEDAASDLMEKGRKTFSNVVDSVGPTAKKGYDEVEKALEGAVNATSKSIKKYPLQSLAIGFGIGCLVGLAVRSFRHSD